MCLFRQNCLYVFCYVTMGVCVCYVTMGVCVCYVTMDEYEFITSQWGVCICYVTMGVYVFITSQWTWCEIVTHNNGWLITLSLFEHASSTVHCQGAVHKVCHAVCDDFWPPSSPLSQNFTNLGPPPLKVCHTSEQKVNKQISRMETALHNYNRHYYILKNNKKRILGLSNKPRNTLTSLISYNSEGDSCSLNLYYAW